MLQRRNENHRIHRVGWLRAAVLGANDGIVSTAALIVGVAAAEASRGNVLGAGLASMVAGALSMGAGTYVSVSSQSDSENADLERERKQLARDHKKEHDELTAIYVARGLDAQLAHQVATQLMAKDALDAHARDELGIFHVARPVQAAFASTCAFTVGAAFPLLLVLMVPSTRLVLGVSCGSLLLLALSGALAARAGGAPIWKSVARVTFWGTLATGLTAVIGAWFGTRL